MQIIDDSPSFLVRLFFGRLRSEETRKNYKRYYAMMSVEPVKFLEDAQKQPKLVSYFLMDWLSKNQEKYSQNTLRTMIVSLKSLADFADVQGINWKKIKSGLAPYRQSKDREVLLEEMCKIYSSGDQRLRFLLSLFWSAGIRVGAIPYLRVKDLVEKDGYGILTIYAGELEEYKTFCTPEAVHNWHVYKTFREMNGERITPDSWLIRSETHKRMTASGTGMLIWQAWHNAGILNREFKQVHGFRKSYKTRLENAGMKTLFIEANLGHAQGIHDNYYRPANIDERFNEYKKYAHILYITEEPALKQVIVEKTRENEAMKKWIERLLQDSSVCLIHNKPTIKGAICEECLEELRKHLTSSAVHT